ncbi:MAG: TlpA disulfide reductase family protein [Bacteroidia bacterium]
MSRIISLFFLSLMLSCQSSDVILPKEGLWRTELSLYPGVSLPFTFMLQQTETGWVATVINGEEKIQSEEFRVSGDSVFFRQPVFDTEFRGKIVDAGKIEGNWYDYSRDNNYHIPFQAVAGETARFPFQSEKSPAEIAPVWRADFQPETPPGNAYSTVGKFEQNGNQLTGTFLTETGDYRFLEGVVDGDSVKLSAFDGSHAFLFLAEKQEAGTLSGKFYSGIHSVESWTAVVEPEAKLRDADSLTFLKPGYDTFTFSFPNLEGKTVSLEDDQYKGKVVIVQLLGSWCPNCLDETKLMKQWYEKYQDEGLEIVGLAFERTKDHELAVASLGRLRDYFGITYEILLAQTGGEKIDPVEKLPMLNHIMAFPTTIFIDRKGNIRRIHTGFSGPGTGKPYEEFVTEYGTFVEEMLGER